MYQISIRTIKKRGGEGVRRVKKNKHETKKKKTSKTQASNGMTTCDKDGTNVRTVEKTEGERGKQQDQTKRKDRKEGQADETIHGSM